MAFKDAKHADLGIGRDYFGHCATQRVCRIVVWTEAENERTAGGNEGTGRTGGGFEGPVRSWAEGRTT